MHDFNSYASISVNATRLRERIASRVSGESRPEWEIDDSVLQIKACRENSAAVRPTTAQVRGVDGT